MSEVLKVIKVPLEFNPGSLILGASQVVAPCKETAQRHDQEVDTDQPIDPIGFPF